MRSRPDLYGAKKNNDPSTKEIQMPSILVSETITVKCLDAVTEEQERLIEDAIANAYNEAADLMRAKLTKLDLVVETDF